MRPCGSTKERSAIFDNEFFMLKYKIQTDFTLSTSTKNKLYLAYTLLFLTGCRVSEIVNLTCNDLNMIFKENVLALNNQTKTKRPRTIYFTDSMLKLIEIKWVREALEHGGIKLHFLAKFVE